MASITTRQMTVEEFRQLPETEPFYYELRHGELVKVTRPKHKHYALQCRLAKLLRDVAGERGHATMYLAFRALPEYEMRVAEVAYVSKTRWEAIDLEDNFRGSPDLVIEILSSSKSTAELDDKKELCLSNGSLQFWTADLENKTVEVSTPDGITKAYRAGQTIPFSGRTLDIDAIFA